MEAAANYRTAAAISLYTKSIEANPNPAPLINRAKLYRWRLLFADAIRDLELAQKLDKNQGNEFTDDIDRELEECKLISSSMSSGGRASLLADLQKNGHDFAAGRLIDVIFKDRVDFWAYHLVNEVDNVQKFENSADFPIVGRLLETLFKDPRSIDDVLADPVAAEAFLHTGLMFQGMISVYEYPDMVKLRCIILEKIFNALQKQSGSKEPSNNFQVMGHGVEIVSIIRDGEVLFTAETVKAYPKEYLEGQIFEVMLSTRSGNPYFVYYLCRPYYFATVAPGGAATFGGPANTEQFRSSVARRLSEYLVLYLHHAHQIDARTEITSFSHNKAHTNVLTYVTSLDAWYPIQQNDDEIEDAAKLRAAEVNAGGARITDVVAVSERSPSQIF